MAWHLVVKENANIAECPVIDAQFKGNADTHLTIGDLHGSVMKLIYFLIYHDVLEMSPIEYQILEKICSNLVNFYRGLLNLQQEKMAESVSEEEYRADNDLKDQNGFEYQEQIISALKVFNNEQNKAEDKYIIQNRAQYRNQIAKDLKTFNKIIAKAKIKNKPTILLIGDDTADRNGCDYLTLKVLEKLGEEDVPFNLLLSNHSTEFIGAYEAGFDKNPESYISNFAHRGQTQSLEVLGLLIIMGLINTKEINHLVEKYYLPNLLLVKYTVNNPERPTHITLYTHATVGLETIKELADILLGEYHYDDSSIEALAETIDRINEEYYYQVISHKAIYKKAYPTKGHMSLYRTGQKRNQCQSIYEWIMWNRDHVGADIPETKNGYKIMFVHGHNGLRNIHADPKHIINLNNLFAKDPGYKIHEYTALYSDEASYIAIPKRPTLTHNTSQRHSTHKHKSHLRNKRSSYTGH